MEMITRKLTSRKLWMSVAAFVSGLIVAFDGSAAVAETVSGCIMAGAAVVAYVLGEGLIDRAAAGQHASEQEADEGEG
ncbi:MAG: hypothetical protein J6R04_06930 [Clostridia bacterium]|nr:hypothetical protein [Clostridia bacterium]